LLHCYIDAESANDANEIVDAESANDANEIDLKIKNYATFKYMRIYKGKKCAVTSFDVGKKDCIF